MKEGREEGMKEGREKGEREKQAEIARRLKEMGVAVDVIAGGTGLSVEEIERL